MPKVNLEKGEINIVRCKTAKCKTTLESLNSSSFKKICRRTFCVKGPMNTSLKSRESCGFVPFVMILSYVCENEQSVRFNHRKYTHLISLFSFFFPQKLYQGLLVVFCFLFCIFRFLVINKNAELVHVFFVYFVGFLIRSIFVTKVWFPQMKTLYKSSS